MAINSSDFNKLPGSKLTRYNAIDLLNAGMSAGLFRQGLTQDLTYQQMISLKATKIVGYMAINNSTVQQAIEAISGQSISTYASVNGFMIENVNGISYLKKSFTGSDTYTPPSLLLDINSIVLLVAGGGAGMGDHGGGGGGGGLVTNNSFSINSSINITIGQGGVTRGYVASSNGQRPADYSAAQVGGNTILGSLTAFGGGAGRGYNGSSSNWAGGPGGSGGGSSNSAPSSSASQPSSASGGFGNSGSGGNNGSSGYGGGGGGAGGSGSSNGTGGSSYTFIGSSYSSGGYGGSNGGGTTGAANTGNGGNGATDPGTGGSGGSGIAIIRYNLSTLI
jgi:hypothetical protein